MSETSLAGREGRTASPQVLFASNNFETSGILNELVFMLADPMVRYAKNLGYDGLALMAMRWWVQAATHDVVLDHVPGVELLQEARPLHPIWTSPKSLAKNAMRRYLMPSTHIGPLQPATRLLTKARKRNPVPVMIHIDPEGNIARDIKKVERLGGAGNVSVVVGADFMEAASADSPDAVVNELGKRSLLGVFDTFASDSRSRSTGELPKVAAQEWLGPVAAAGRLGGIGFSAYRTDREGPGSERFTTHIQEMDALLLSQTPLGGLHEQMDALREVSVPYVVVNMPHKRAKQAFARFQEHLTPSPITRLADLHEIVAATVRMQGIGTQAI